MALILHITQRAAWEAARQTGSYTAPSLATQGFIHCSRPDQVTRVADFLFRGQPGLVLICIAPDRLTAPLRFESPAGSEAVFPHIYGPLNLDAVSQVLDFPPQEDGTFALPKAISELDE